MRPAGNGRAFFYAAETSLQTVAGKAPTQIRQDLPARICRGRDAFAAYNILKQHLFAKSAA
jgi:hypothetical protein